MSQERQPYANIIPTRSRYNTLDTHEILRKEIYASGDEGGGYRDTQSSVNMSTAIATNTSVDVSFEDINILISTLTKDLSSNLATGDIVFPITSFNNNNDIKDCVAIKLGSFYFPNIRTDQTVPRPDYFYYRRGYIGLTIPMVSSANAEFEFQVDDLNSAAVKWTPIMDTMYFKQPISSLSTLGFQFLAPHGNRKINIPDDLIRVQTVAGSNPGRFIITSGENTDVLGPLGVQPAPGVAVYGSGFGSTSATFTSINNRDGNFVTNIIDSTTFEMGAYNFTAIGTFGGTIYIPKNRISMQVRFTCLVRKPGNYVSVTHD